MEYKRPDVGLKIYREFSNLRLGVYTPYALENSNQCLINEWCIFIMLHVVVLSEHVFQLESVGEKSLF